MLSPLLGSAPSRTLGRRKLIRNRFTIDTSVVFDDGSSQELSPISPAEPPLSSLQKPQQPIRDTDRWVEDQFDLQHYENQDDVKETDILSDDDEYCQSIRGPSSEPSLEESLEALSVEAVEDKGLNGLLDDKSQNSHAPLKLTLLRKQCAVEGVTSETDCEVIWVRRDDFKNSCNSDIFWAEGKCASCCARVRQKPTESKPSRTWCTDNPTESQNWRTCTIEKRLDVSSHSTQISMQTSCHSSPDIRCQLYSQCIYRGFVLTDRQLHVLSVDIFVWNTRSWSICSIVVQVLIFIQGFVTWCFV